MKSKVSSKKNREKKAKGRVSAQNFSYDRNFGTAPDRALGKYLQERGLPALAEILKIDK